MFLGALLSGIVAYITIDWFLRLLDRIGMLPFVIYRLILGGVLLYLFLPG
jgi:undecaprenyl-diphosphatase